MADAAPQDQEPEAPAEEPTPAPAEEEEREPLELEVPAFEMMDDAMAWIWGEVRRVPKSGVHPKQGWKFATESDIADLIRDLCAHAGVTIHQTLRKHREVQIGSTSNGNPIWRHIVTVRYQLRWRGETWPTTTWRGEADDSSDKGLAKALTACRKTYLIATFQVSSGDDPDRAETPEVEGPARLTAPRGKGKARGEYRSPTAEADPKTEEQQQEAARLRLALGQRLGEIRPEENPDERLRKFINTKAQEIGVSVLDMNRTEFEVILDALREQAGKMLPGWDSKTGEWAPGTGPDAPKPADDPEVAPPAEAGQAPAQAQDAPVPAAVPPAVQQAIEGAAAATPLAGAPIDDPDLPAPKPGDTYRESLEQAARHGIEEVRVIEMMMKAGAARPEDLDAGPTQIAFLNLLDAAVNEAWTPEPTDNGQEELS